MNKTDVYLIDASIYVFRNYYSMPDTLISKNGIPINAVYGFTQFLTQFIHHTKAQYIACAFDISLDTSIRNDIFPEYKANREPAPPDLKKQFRICQKVADHLGVTTYADGYYEADDLIGTLADHHQKKGHRVHIISADKDLAQLICDDDRWWNYGKSEPLDTQQVFEKFGVHPHQIADFLALTGDAVDNIPGVPGIGPKTAAILLNHFKDIETLIKRQKEITYLSFRGAKSCQQKIANNLDALLLARKLTEIIKDVPIDSFDIKRKPINTEKINTIFDFLKFGPLLRRRILDIKNI